jgi:hypothetical protein
VVKASGLGNPRGFIDVKDTYQTLAYHNVYAAGIAAAVNAPWQTANAVGVPKTVGEEGIQVRGLVRSVTLRWPEVRDIHLAPLKLPLLFWVPIPREI